MPSERSVSRDGYSQRGELEQKTAFWGVKSDKEMFLGQQRWRTLRQPENGANKDIVGYLCTAGPRTTQDPATWGHSHTDIFQ